MWLCVLRLPGSMDFTTHACNAYKMQGCVTDCVMCLANTLNVWALVAVGGNAANEAVSSC